MKENNAFCGSLLIEQAHHEYRISDRSRYIAGFVTRVVPTSTKHEFLQMVGEQRKCSAHGLMQLDDCEEEMCAYCCSRQKKAYAGNESRNL